MQVKTKNQHILKKMAIFQPACPLNTNSHSQIQELYYSKYFFFLRYLKTFSTSINPHQKPDSEVCRTSQIDSYWLPLQKLRCLKPFLFTPSWCTNDQFNISSHQHTWPRNKHFPASTGVPMFRGGSCAPKSFSCKPPFFHALCELWSAQRFQHNLACSEEGEQIPQLPPFCNHHHFFSLLFWSQNVVEAWLQLEIALQTIFAWVTQHMP